MSKWDVNWMSLDPVIILTNYAVQIIIKCASCCSAFGSHLKCAKQKKRKMKKKEDKKITPSSDDTFKIHRMRIVPQCMNIMRTQSELRGADDVKWHKNNRILYKTAPNQSDRLAVSKRAQWITFITGTFAGSLWKLSDCRAYRERYKLPPIYCSQNINLDNLYQSFGFSWAMNCLSSQRRSNSKKLWIKRGKCAGNSPSDGNRFASHKIKSNHWNDFVA